MEWQCQIKIALLKNTFIYFLKVVLQYVLTVSLL